MNPIPQDIADELQTADNLRLSRKALKFLYANPRHIPAGFRGCDGWGCDPPTNEDVAFVGVENHASGADVTHYFWLEREPVFSILTI